MDPNDNTSNNDNPVSDLGALANELNNYDPTAELQNMAAESSAADATAAAAVAPITNAVATDPSLNPASLATPSMEPPVPENPAAPTNNMAAPQGALDATMPTDNLDAAAPAGAPVLQPSPDFVAPTVAPSTPSPLDDVAPLAPTPDNPNAAQPVGDSITPQIPTDLSQSPLDNPAPMDTAPQNPAPMDMDMSMGQPAAPGAEQPAAPTEVPTGPVKAAGPLPGSIGSAMSYADIQRAAAERQAKAAAGNAARKNGKVSSGLKKVSTTTWILIATAAIVLVIVGIVIAINVIGSSSNPKPTPTPTPPTSDEPETIETLICKVDMEPKDYAGMRGVLGAQRSNTFVFEDGELVSIKVEQIYQTDSIESALANKQGYDSSHSASGTSAELKEPSDSSSSSTKVDDSGRATLEQVVTSTNDSTYTFMRYISKDKIEDWISSSYYDPSEFGIKVPEGEDPADYTSIDDMKDGHNSKNFSCSVTTE